MERRRRKRIDQEELIDTEFKIWLEKRKEERKVAEEKWKEDPKYCYEMEKEGVIRLTDEAYDRYQGPISKEIYETVKSGRKVEKPVRALIPPTRGEVNAREVSLLLHHPSKQRHLEYSLGHLGEISGVSLDCLPQGPGYWTRVAHTVVQNMGLNEMDATEFTMHFVETAVQLSGICSTDSAIPQVLHPVIGPVVTDRIDQPDLRARWVKYAVEHPEFGPEDWMWSAFKYMQPFTAADGDFRLDSEEERFHAVDALETSMDIRDSEVFSRMNRMFFTYTGSVADEPKNLLRQKVTTIPQLAAALDDLETNGSGHPSFAFPTNFPFSKENKVEVIRRIFAIDFEFASLEPQLFMGMESKDVRKGVWLQGNWPRWLDCFAFTRDWAAIVPFDKRAN